MAKNLYLAQELLSEIVGYLHTDEWDVPWIYAPENKRDFHSCSLVSHAWNAATRPHLFRDIAYSFRLEDKCAPYETSGSEEEFEMWRLFVLTRQLVRCKTLRMLCTFLRENPAVQPYVRSLKLELWPSRQPLNSSEWKLGPEDEIDASLFGDLLVLLPQLTVLHLHNVFVSKRPKFLSPVTRIRLQRLQIATSSIQNEHENKTLWVGPTSVLDHTLVFFADVGELHLSTWELYDTIDVEEATDVETGNESTTVGLSVRHLVLDGLKWEPRQLQRLLEHSVSSLRRLTFLANDSGPRLNPAISERFMHFVAAHIEELDIFVGRGREGYMYSDGVEFTNVAIAQLTNLRKLRIGIVLSASNGFYQHTANFSLSGLATRLAKSASKLEELTLELSIDTWLDIESYIYATIAGSIDSICLSTNLSIFRGVFVEMIPLRSSGKPKKSTETHEVLEATLRKVLDGLDFSLRPVSSNNWLEYYTHTSHPTWLAHPS